MEPATVPSLAVLAARAYGRRSRVEQEAEAHLHTEETREQVDRVRWDRRDFRAHVHPRVPTKAYGYAIDPITNALHLGDEIPIGIGGIERLNRLVLFYEKGAALSHRVTRWREPMKHGEGTIGRPSDEIGIRIRKITDFVEIFLPCGHVRRENPRRRNRLRHKCSRGGPYAFGLRDNLFD